jgi:hypothetical protein
MICPPREVAYGPSPIDSSTHRIKQIVLWMDALDSPQSSMFEALAQRDKITVDRWHFNV